MTGFTESAGSWGVLSGVHTCLAGGAGTGRSSLADRFSSAGSWTGCPARSVHSLSAGGNGGNFSPGTGRFSSTGSWWRRGLTGLLVLLGGGTLTSFCTSGLVHGWRWPVTNSRWD